MFTEMEESLLDTVVFEITLLRFSGTELVVQVESRASPLKSEFNNHSPPFLSLSRVTIPGYVPRTNRWNQTRRSLFPRLTRTPPRTECLPAGRFLTKSRVRPLSLFRSRRSTATTTRSESTKRALDMLRSDLAALRTLEEPDQMGRNPAKDLLSNFLEDTDDLEKTGRNLSRELLSYWLKDSDLADVRDPKALEILPVGERQKWQQFWTDVKKRHEELATREVAPRPHTKK